MRAFNLFIVLLFLTIMPALFVISSSPRLILYMENVYELPARFRMATNDFPSGLKEYPSNQGLAELNLSGSGQFSEEGLHKIKDIIPKKKLLLVDLRQESHGFINGMAVSWFSNRDWSNKDKTPEEVEADQAHRLESALLQRLVIIYRKKIFPFLLRVENVKSEDQLSKELGVSYARLYITDHIKPKNEDVNAFIELVKDLDSETWLHIHCAGGKGRTTTFMVMYDMMRNANQVSYEDIMERQLLISGKDLRKSTHDSWKHEYAMERIRFLKKFYRYAKEHPKFEKNWSTWIKENS